MKPEPNNLPCKISVFCLPCIFYMSNCPLLRHSLVIASYWIPLKLQRDVTIMVLCVGSTVFPLWSQIALAGNLQRMLQTTSLVTTTAEMGF